MRLACGIRLEENMRRHTKKLIIVIGVILSLVGGGYAWHRYYFPYGQSHCCDLILWFELRHYAEEHKGWFPKGESSPESSLSLLFREGYVNAYLLRGKTVPLEVVQPILARGDLLTPDTCGWHYVEGLRMDDDPRIALLWDKAGLSHSGQRLSSWRWVTLIDGTRQSVELAKWDEFLAEQEILLFESNRKRKNALGNREEKKTK
jgi:hypothetical protein